MSKESSDFHYPAYPASEQSNRLLTRHELRAARRREREQRGRRPYRTLRALGTFAVATTLLYGLDVAHGKQELQNTRSSIETVLPARSAADSNKAIVDAAGWGNLNAYNTAAALPTFAEDGNLWAIRYDNTGLDTDKIADQLVEKAKANGVQQLSFSGHSMGGLVNLEIARKIYEGHNGIDVPYVILDCTPANIDAVRPDVRSDGYTMVNALSHIPGARDSSAVRFIAEEGARFHQYEDLTSPLLIDPAKFVDATKRIINDKFLSEDAASTSLLDSQFKFIVASGARDNILALGKDNGKPKPILVYLRPKDAGADHTVDNDDSERQFRKYAAEAGLELVVIDIDGIGHANPIQRPSEYNAALARTVFPRIAFEQELAADAKENQLAARSQQQTENDTVLSDPAPGS